VLVALALDDLECGNLDVETALRFVAHRAWAAELRDAQNARGGRRRTARRRGCLARGV
jgi:hypothetical protein